MKTTNLDTLRALADAAIARRRAVLYAPGRKPRVDAPRDWDGQRPDSHYGDDGHLLPEIQAVKDAARAAG